MHRFLTMPCTALLDAGQFGACFDFIHCEFLSFLEAAMNGVIKALRAFEERCKYFSACDWLCCQFYSLFKAANEWVSQKIEVFTERCTEYTNRVFLPTEAVEGTNASPDSIILRKGRLLHHETYSHHTISSVNLDLIKYHFSVCTRMKNEASWKSLLWYVCLTEEVAGSPYCTLRHCRWGQGCYWSCKTSPVLSTWPHWVFEVCCGLHFRKFQWCVV